MGKEYDTPPSAAMRHWMHPDAPHYYNIGTCADYSTPCDYAYLADSETLFEVSTSEFQDDPKSLKEAQTHADWSEWQQAMDHEISTLKGVGTWINIPCPTDKNIVGSKWVFCIKQKADGSIEKYKA